MRFWAYSSAIPLCILLISTLFLSGCTTSWSIGPDVPRGEGFTDITPRNEIEYISLNEAIEALKSTDLAQKSSPLHIHYIRGDSITSNGTAKGWIIGVFKDREPFYFVWRGGSQYTMACNSELPHEEIDPERFMDPKALFDQRPLLLQDLTEGNKREINSLELMDGSYVMTYLSGDTMRVFYFDAVSGIEARQEHAHIVSGEN